MSEQNTLLACMSALVESGPRAGGIVILFGMLVMDAIFVTGFSIIGNNCRTHMSEYVTIGVII